LLLADTSPKTRKKAVLPFKKKIETPRANTKLARLDFAKQQSAETIAPEADPKKKLGALLK